MESADYQQLALWLRDGVFVALILVTSWTDTRTSKVLNKHTFPAMALGLLLSGVGLGLDGVLASALGLAIAFAVMFPLFAFGIMRAGDAKLLMAFGALAGAGVAVRGLLASCFVFVPVALVLLVYRGRLGGVWPALKRIWRFFYTALHPVLKAESLGTEDALMTPFALVLGVGALIAWQTSFLAVDFNLG